MRSKIFFLCLLTGAVTFLLMSCAEPDYQKRINPLLDKYLEAWNTGNIALIDTIVSEKFELRINPAFEAKTGIEELKESILNTRYAFNDFNVNVIDRIFLSDTAVVIRWIIKGTYSNPEDSTLIGRKTEAAGFSIIFFNEDKLTGEWIAYSDLTWMKNLGLNLVPTNKGKK